MSFNSNYLKLRQEREGNTANNAGGTTPPASSEEKTTSSGSNSYTSSYLALREKRNNMTISERAEARAQALLKKQQEQARTPAGIFRNATQNRTGLTTSGGYYSRPTLGGASEKLYSNVTALEPVLTEKRTALDTAQTSLLQAESDLKTVQEYLDQARAVYDADPTEANANSYNQIVGAYNLAYDSYASAFNAYSVAYDDYKPYEDQLIDALAVYQLYSNQQQAAFDDWRGTIRDAATIQTEIEAIDQQMADLEVAEAAAAEAARQQQLAEYQARQDAKPWYEKLAGYLGGVQDTTLPLAGVTPGTVDAALEQTQESVSREMQRLLDMKELLQEELGWSQYYYYADMADASDFAEMSQYVPQERTERRALDIMLDNYSDDASGWEDPLYEYINGNEEAGAYISNAGANYYGSDNAIGAFFGRATENKAESQQMTEQEIATFNYLYATQGKAAAHAYYDYLLADLNYRQRKADEEYWAEYAAQDPVGSSVFSVAMSPMKGLSYVGQLTDYLGDGEIDQNAAYNKFSYIPSSIRGQVVQQIEESGKWGKVGSFAYQTGLSMADFLLASTLTGNNQALTLTIMGSGAAADATMSAKERGLTDDQAFALGTITGILEGLIESANMETVLKPDALKDSVIRYVLKNATAEGLEEVATDVGNLVFDVWIAGDQNLLQVSVENYMKQGMTEGEATARTFADQALQMMSDFAGGFVSGGILSGANTGIHVNYTNRAAKQSGQQNQQSGQTAAQQQGQAENTHPLTVQAEAAEESTQDQGPTPSSAAEMRKQAYEAFYAGEITQDEFDAWMEEVWHQEELEGGPVETTADFASESETSNLHSKNDDTQTERQYGAVPYHMGALRDAYDAAIANGDTAAAQKIADVITEQGGRVDPLLSVADRLRQEQNPNGGTQYESTYERATGPAVTQPAGEFDTERTNVPDGVQVGDAGQSAAEQTGVLAGGAERTGSKAYGTAKALIQRQNTAGNLRQQGLIQESSSSEIGIAEGTDTRKLLIYPESAWDQELQILADSVRQETGCNVIYVMGKPEIRGAGGSLFEVRGAYTGDSIIVQLDNGKATPAQIADHEAFHAKVDKTSPVLIQEIKNSIIERYSKKEFDKVLDRYVEELWSIYGTAEDAAWEDVEAACMKIAEEVLADAYAGINAFGTHAGQFTETVNERMTELGVGKIRNQDNGTEEPTGPPNDDRYSIETLPDGKKYVRADRQVIFGNDPDSWSEQVEDYINGRIRRGQDVTLIAEDGDVLTITSTTAGKLADNHTGRGATMPDEDFYVKSNAAVHIDELSQISTRGQTKKDLGSRHGEFASGGWNYRTAFFQDFDGRYYKLQISVAQNEQGNVVYNVGRIEERSSPTIYGSSAKGGALGGKTSFEKSVPQADRAVKQRFSYAGENANNADLDALARAKEMQAAGVADETIRQQTGWHTGMDGKWRWEIDDSTMRYDSSGDLRGAESAKWAMEDYESARDELWGHADMDTLDKVRAYNRADIAGDDTTKQELYDELMGGPHAYYFDQYVEAMARAQGARNAPAGGTLQDYIDHPALFEAYPQLRNVTLRFERMGGGMMGYYSRTDNEIVLNTELRYAAEDTLVHEIQHAIQKAEGFTRGSNEEYWKQRQEGDDAVHVYDAKIQDSEKKMDEIMRQLPENVAEQFRQWSAMDDSSPEAMALMQELWDGPYNDLFEDYWFLNFGLDDMRRTNYKRGPRDLYKNTAGEIEARDVTARRSLTPEQRRSREPARGDSYTVFMEDSDELSLQLGDRFSVDDERSQHAQQTQEQNSSSYSEDGGTEEAGIRDTLPVKAQQYLARAERKLLNDIGEKLNVPRYARRDYLQAIVREISDEYLRTGTVADGVIDNLFDRAYEQGVVVDAEFYNQYKEIKDHLRTTPVTISEQDRHDIADFNDFRRGAMGTLRIVNQGGLPVDVAYMELQSMAKELFPDDITHPADQLMHMYEVAQSIRKSEKSLDEYYGSEAAEYRSWAKNDFAASVGDAMVELRTVKRFMDERSAQENSEAAPQTPEEAAAAYKKLKDARRVYERAAAKNLLTEHDEMLVGRLLRGEIEPQHLDPATDNVKGITAVYEAKQEYERLVKLLAEYRRGLKSKLRDKADSYLETANDWKDKKVGALYSRETMSRNVQDIVPDKAVARAVNQEYFEPIAVAEGKSTQFKTRYRDRVRSLNLSTKVAKGNLVSEAHAVQLLGEAQDNIRMLEKARGRVQQRDGKSLAEWRSVIGKLWEESPKLNQAKIERAVKEFRAIYDELFEMMNQVRIENGYEPVNYRNGYFPHFQPGDGDGIMAQFGRAMGIDTQVTALPTTINGLTHTFKPGIQWFGNAQERLGFNTAYDAVEGFDKYIEGVASVIHQTGNIQNLRAFGSQIRYRTSDEGIRKQVDAVYANPAMTDEQKQVQINDIYEHGKYTLSNFVSELDEYTNILANKKSRLDRTVEAFLGRRIYTIMKNWESRVGANMIAGNLSSALTNFIPLTQAGARLDRGSVLQGMWKTLQSYKENDGIIEKSAFLTNRQGSDPLIKTWTQKASEWMGKPMEYIDNFTAGSIVRAAYYQNLRKGMSETEAIHQADLFAASVMADRSKGAMPTLFEAKNPLAKMFTQFQLEVNNQFSEIFKDIPREQKEKGLLSLAAVLLQYFIGAFLYNEVYEYFVGRRAALDPFGILNDTVGDLTGYELPNLVEWGLNVATGEETSFETEKVGVGEAMKNLGSTALGELPFSSGLTLLGIETDGGRIPASSAVPDLTALWDAATTEGWSPEKRWKEATDEFGKLMYVLPPFGGNQMQKLWKGIKAYIEGGSYNVDASGEKFLQYPVYKDEPAEALANALRMALFGKSSLPTAQDWVDSGFDSLGTKQTIVYQDMMEAGATGRESFNLLMELQEAEKTDDKTRVAVQRDILRESGVSDDAMAIAYYGLLASESDRELMDSLTDAGAAPGEVAKVLMEISDAGALKGAEASCAKRDAIANSALTEEEKIAIYRSKVSESRDDDIEAFRVAGLDFDEFLRVQNQYATINEQDANATAKATDLSRWVDDQNYTDSQAATIKDSFAYYNQIPASASRYDKLVDASMDPDDAYELTGALGEIQPPEGEDEVSDLQKWRASVDFSDNVGDQLTALYAVMEPDQFRKVEIANNFGVSPDAYVTLQEIKPQYDADGNGSYKQKEIQAAIDGMPGYYTTEQKAVLWQLATGSTSSRNNPYSRQVGQQVLDARAAAKEAAAQEQAETPTDSTDDDSFSQELLNQLLGKK